MNLVQEIGHCELCGHDPTRTKFGNVRWALHEHHIARGVHRAKAVGKRFTTLALCYHCHINRIHNGREHWSQARQLAILKRSRPADHDLPAFNELVGYGPDRITEADVDKWQTERNQNG